MSSSGDSIYVRVKRQQQTFCFLCEPSETILSIKEKISTILGQHEKSTSAIPSIESFRILRADATLDVLDDAETVESIRSHQKSEGTDGGMKSLPNDTTPSLLLYLVLPIAASSSDPEWEPVQVVNTDIE